MSSTCTLNSSDVIVFPLSKTRPTNGVGLPTADGSVTGVDLNKTRLLTEKSVSNIIYQLIDTDGFLIGYTTDETGNKFDIEFNLVGYYFRVTLDFTPTTDGGKPYLDWQNIFATITISDEYDEIVGQDINGKYEGLVLSDEAPSGSGTHALKLLTKTGNKWEPPKDCYNKFSITSLGITGLDGNYK
jgi:hypothetical protein